MDEVIWVEVLSRHRDVMARYRCTGPEIRIGRSYANDVVVDDPYVASDHLRILRDDTGALVAEDFGSANGLFADRSTVKLARIVLDGNRPIRIGHTYLRIRKADHAVPRERLLESRVRRWPAVTGLAVAIAAIELVTQWLGDTSEPKLSRYLQPPLVVLIGVLGWTAAWAILSRIFSGRASFERNLLVTLAGILFVPLYGQIAAFAGFALAWRFLETYQSFVACGVLAAVCFLHLRVIGPSRLKLKGIVVLTLLGIAITMQILIQSELRAGFGPPNAAHRLMPPALRLTPVESESAFIADIEGLKTKLDRARKEEPPSAGWGLGFDDD